MPSIVHGSEKFTIAAGQTLYMTTTWSPGPNQGPVFCLADPTPGQEIEALLTTFDYSKCRNAPEGGGNAPGTHEVFYQYKVRSESRGPVTFGMEFFNPK